MFKPPSSFLLSRSCSSTTATATAPPAPLPPLPHHHHHHHHHPHHHRRRRRHRHRHRHRHHPAAAAATAPAPAIDCSVAIMVLMVLRVVPLGDDEGFRVHVRTEVRCHHCFLLGKCCLRRRGIREVFCVLWAMFQTPTGKIIQKMPKISDTDTHSVTQRKQSP